MRVLNSVSWSVASFSVTRRDLSPRSDADETSTNAASSLDVAAEWLPSTSLSAVDRELPSALGQKDLEPSPDSANTLPVTAAQRSMFRELPSENFFAQFQASFSRITQTSRQLEPNTASPGSNANTNPFDADIQQLLEQTLGATHVEHTEMVFRFACQHEPEKADGVSTSATFQFASILNRAYEANAWSDAKSFLGSLSPDELSILQNQHGLADPISVSALSDEGAKNLLLPGGYGIDLNRDGLNEVGAARLFSFPPAEAPDEFKAAWFEATQQLDAAELGLAELPFLAIVTVAQISVTTVEVQQPQLDDANWYQQIVDHYLQYLDDFQSSLADGQFERDKPIFEQLRTLLAGQGQWSSGESSADQTPQSRS